MRPVHCAHGRDDPAPVAGSRILAGLAASLFAPEQVTVAGLWGSQAVRAGLIAWGDELAPLPGERYPCLPGWWLR